MKGLIVKDWSRVDFHNREHVRKMMGAVQHFLRLPDTNKGLRAAMMDAARTGSFQHFTTKGNFPDEVWRVIEKYQHLPVYDLAYEEIFDIRDFTGTTESGFEILDVQSGIMFDEVKTGEKARLYQFSGAKTRVPFVRYGAGLNWDRNLIEDKQYWELEDGARAVQAGFYEKRAETFYDLITAVSSTQDVAWQDPDPATLENTNALYTASRDANTINKACEDILSDLKGKGMGVSTNSQFILLAPVSLRKRILKAMDLMSQAVVGAQKELIWNVSPRFSLMLTGSDYYVILPKNKLKGGYRQHLTLLYGEDILAYADQVVAWGRWGGAVGEPKQIRRCKTAA